MDRDGRGEDVLKQQYLENEGDRFDRLVGWTQRKDVGVLLGEMLVRGWRQPDKACEREVSELAIRVGATRTRRFPVYLMSDLSMCRCILEPVVTLEGPNHRAANDVTEANVVLELHVPLAFIGVRRWETDPEDGKLVRHAVFIHTDAKDIPRTMNPHLVLAGWQSVHLLASEIQTDPRRTLEALLEKVNRPWELTEPLPEWH